MRVVAGSLRGRRLSVPPGRRTRPTSDRVKEATFNALVSLDVLRDAEVLDLFAGSGALGIEALSRGARHCTFVEDARPAVAAIRENVRVLGLSDRTTIVPMNVGRYLSGTAVASADVALVDPPYDFDEWPALLAAIPAGLVVAESDHAVIAAGWDVVRDRRYGTTHVTILRRAAP